MSRVLWLDNDPGNVDAFVKMMGTSGIDVTVARSVIAAERFLRNQEYDLLILDVMIPLEEIDIEQGYDYANTEDTLSTGLAFYRRNRDFLLQKQVRVLVLTVRIDSDVQDKFFAAGLPRGNFATRYQVREWKTFFERIRTLLGDER